MTASKDFKLNYYLVIFLAIYLSLSFRAIYILSDIAYTDFATQWRICAYTLKGINIYSLRGSSEFIPEIGEISSGFHASPWGCLLQNIFYGGFLSLDNAKIYFVIASIIVLITASCVIYSKVKKFSSHLALITLIISLFSPFYMMSFHEGNAGGMICAFLLMAWALCDEHKFISGVLIAFAMVKPQDAGIICIAFLLLKKFAPVIIAAVIDIISWLIVSILTHSNMLQLLRDFISGSNVNFNPNPFAGIFHFATNNLMIAMFASMLFGIIFAGLIIKFLPDNMPEFFKIYPAFMAVTFWSYSYNNDCYVLILPASLCLWLMMTSKRAWLWTLGNLGMLCSFSLYIFRGLNTNHVQAVNAVSSNSDSIIIIHKHLSRNIYEAGIILLGIIMCLELRKIFNDKEQI